MDQEVVIAPKLDVDEVVNEKIQGVSIVDTFEKIMAPFALKLLEDINIMRTKRCSERELEKRNRGRPQFSCSNDAETIFSSEKYQQRFKKPFSKENLRSFLACFYRMCTLNAYDMKTYWTIPSHQECGHGLWFKCRMSRYLYDEMYRCLDLKINDWITTLNTHLPTCKPISKYVSLDETMAPYQGRHNPHFVFVPRKPHPYGMKFETTADEHNYLFAFHLLRRTVDEPEKPAMFKSARKTFDREELGSCDSESVITVSLGMCAPLDNNQHVLITDRYFGGVNLAIELQKRGIDSVAKCKSNRPTKVWEILQNEEPNEMGYVVGQFIGENGLPLYCYSHNHGDDSAWANFLSTIPFSNYLEKVISSVDGEAFYNKFAGLVDEANRSIMSCYYQHRILDYHTCILIFFLVVIGHNARVLYNYATGSNLSQVEYLKSLSNALHPIQDSTKRHTGIRKEKRSNCSVCYFKNATKHQHLPCNRRPRNKTFQWCTCCEMFVCNTCFNTMDHWYCFQAKQKK